MPKRKYTTQGYRDYLGRKKARYSTKNNAASIIQRAWRAKRKPALSLNVQRLRTGGYLGLDGKWVEQDVTTGTFAGGNTWVYCDHASDALGAVPRGDGVNERIGNKVWIRYLSARLTCYAYDNVVSSISSGTLQNYARPTRWRIVLFVDKQTNGAQTGATNVFPNDLHAFRDMSNVDRYKVLYDQVHFGRTNGPTATYNGTAAIGGFSSIAEVRINIPINRKFTYTVGSTTASIANLQDNSLHLMCLQVDGASMDGNVMSGKVKTYYEG